MHADQLEEERLLEKRTEIVPITEESAKLLDGNVEKQRKILSNFVPDVSHFHTSQILWLFELH